MSGTNHCGGVPYVESAAFDTTGRKAQLPFFTSYIIVRNLGANVGKLFFTQKDWEDGVNFVTIPVAAATHPYGEWQGPVETAHDKYSDLYLQGVGGNATLELVAFQRRG